MPSHRKAIAMTPTDRSPNPAPVVGFTDDIVMPPHLSAQVADALSNERYEKIPDTEHLCFLERPDVANAAIPDFFARGPSSTYSAILSSAGRCWRIDAAGFGGKNDVICGMWTMFVAFRFERDVHCDCDPVSPRERAERGSEDMLYLTRPRPPNLGQARAWAVRRMRTDV